MSGRGPPWGRGGRAHLSPQPRAILTEEGDPADSGQSTLEERSPRAEGGRALRDRTHPEGLGEALGRLQNPEAAWEGLSFAQAVEVKPAGRVVRVLQFYQ